MHYISMHNSMYYPHIQYYQPNGKQRRRTNFMIIRRPTNIRLPFDSGYSKPRLECPKDVIAELPPGRDEAFVTFDQPSTDLDWFRYVRSKPSWGTRLEANLTPGVHEITFFARHPVSKKQASCVLRIIVKGD